jgi:hypothetical protein
MARVKNLIGTGGKSCSCGSWLQHWENNTITRVPLLCVANGCNNFAKVGGHVKKTDTGANDAFIIPICDSCNNLTEEYTVLDGHFVSANKSKTCSQ